RDGAAQPAGPRALQALYLPRQRHRRCGAAIAQGGLLTTPRTGRGRRAHGGRRVAGGMDPRRRGLLQHEPLLGAAALHAAAVPDLPDGDYSNVPATTIAGIGRLSTCPSAWADSLSRMFRSIRRRAS